MALKGRVNDISFSSAREMVEIIYTIFFKNNPDISLLQFEEMINKYQFSCRINDSNDRSFLKSEPSYKSLNEHLKKRFYSPNSFTIEEQKYYLRTETGGNDTTEHIRFAEHNGIVISLNNKEILNSGNDTTDIQSKEVEELDLTLKSNQDNDMFFKLISISDLKDKKFYIPDYQRGYRWLDETEYFIKDIEENEDGKNYLFQPLVVRKINSCKYRQSIIFNENNVELEITPESNDVEINNDEKLYEVIDGQQRLTTLFLVLQSMNVDPCYSLFYENKREIDNIYIKLAKSHIDETIKSVKPGFIDKLKKEARFIWYEDKTNREAEDIFRSFNADKTELTSAELFKALLIHIKNDENSNLIAYQFDEIEQQLNDEDLWRFISDNKYISNRIELILDIFAFKINKILTGDYDKDTAGAKRIVQVPLYGDKAKKLNERCFDSKFSFLSFDNFCDAIKDENTKNYESLKKYKPLDLRLIWEEIYDIFEIVKSWHADYQTHNLIGYLLARKGKSYKDRIGIIYDLINKQDKNNYDTFVKKLYLKIQDEDLKKNETIIKIEEDYKDSAGDSISYCPADKKRCYNLLLLSNVYYCIVGRTHFNFKCLKEKYNTNRENKVLWDIEHIDSRASNNDLLKIQKTDEEYINFDGSKYKGDGESYVKSLNTIQTELLAFKNDNVLTQDENKTIENFLVKIAKQIDSNSSKCSFKDLNSKVNSIWKKYNVDKEENNSISNLTLLSSDINRSYHNDFFNEKRQIIQSKDEHGYFIPTMTKKIFTSKKYGHGLKWDEDCQNTYRKELNEVIDFIVKEAK